jgi:hypothetical protein
MNNFNPERDGVDHINSFNLTKTIYKTQIYKNYLLSANKLMFINA